MFGAGAEDKILEVMKDLGVLMSDDEEPLGVTMAGIEDGGSEDEIGKLVISRRSVDGRLEASIKQKLWSTRTITCSLRMQSQPLCRLVRTGLAH